MKIAMVSGILFFCIWQNVYSQLLLPYKEAIYQPPYDNSINIISPDVEKWMNEQLAKGSEKGTVEMKTDVMGYHRNSNF